MKPVAIISTYPSKPKLLNALNRCILSYRAAGFDTIVVSHYALDELTIKNTNYYIYDHDNTFLYHNYCPTFYMLVGDVSVQIYTAGHALPICRNMKLGVNLASVLGYDYFIFTESDVVLSTEDMDVAKGYLQLLNDDDKKMVFFKPKDFRDQTGNYVYETLLFGGEIKYFLSKFDIPMTSEDWTNFRFESTLESSIYKMFSNTEYKYLIIDDHSSNVFKSSDVNLARYGLLNCEMVYNYPKPERPILFVMNYSVKENDTKYVTVYKNEVCIENLTLVNYGYWFNDYALDGSEIIVEIYNDEAKTSLEMTRRFKMTDDMLETIITKGDFKITNNESNTDSNRTN